MKSMKAWIKLSVPIYYTLDRILGSRCTWQTSTTARNQLIVVFIQPAGEIDVANNREDEEVGVDLMRTSLAQIWPWLSDVFIKRRCMLSILWFTWYIFNQTLLHLLFSLFSFTEAVTWVRQRDQEQGMYGWSHKSIGNETFSKSTSSSPCHFWSTESKSGSSARFRFRIPSSL